MQSKIRDHKLDAVKGILILLIALEHNVLLTETESWIRPIIDAFVAPAFFMLVFSRPTKILPLNSYLDKYYSYLVPYFFFVTLTSILNFALFAKVGLSEHIGNYLAALLLQSPYFIKQATGFYYFWFLPCLSFLFLLRFIHKIIGDKFLYLMIGITPLIGLIPEDTLIHLPFTAHAALFIYALSFFYGKYYQHLTQADSLAFGCFLIFITLLAVNHMLPRKLLIFSGIIPSLYEPLYLFYYLSIIFVAGPALYYAARFFPKVILMFFALCGKNSLQIYLSHQLFFMFMVKFIYIQISPWWIYLLTIIASLIFSLLISRLPLLNQMIFPSSLSSLFRIFRANKHYE